MFWNCSPRYILFRYEALKADDSVFRTISDKSQSSGIPDNPLSRGTTSPRVWTRRGTSRHIISMRYCHDKEEKRWRKILRQAADR
jgi:hypothetical protein